MDEDTIANAEAWRLHSVVKIGPSILLVGERDIPQIGVDVAHVVEEDAADIRT